MLDKIGGKKDGFMQNWIATILVAVIMFSTSNFMLSDLGVLGMGAFYFYGFGGFCCCILFFIIHYSKFDYKNKDFYDSDNKRRFIWTNEDGSIAWKLIAFYSIAAVF